jgi:nucleotide-binding universal stress UspA family protein
MTDRQAEAGTRAHGLDVAQGHLGIVVGFDESPEGELALGWAADHAKLCDLPLVVVYAANPPAVLPWTSGAFLPSQTDLRQTAARVARRGAERVRRSHEGVQVHSTGVVGSPAAELVALSGSASLVVVGHRPTSAIPGSGLGSVSFALSAHARCPVVVVQGETLRQRGPERPVVVGVDSSRSSLRAVSFAADAAKAAGAELVVVSAWTKPDREPWMNELWSDPGRTADRLAAAYEAAASCAEDAVAQVKQQHPDIVTETRTPEGPPAEALLAESEDAGLLVVGPRGHGGFAGLALGSVTRAVIRHAELPVAVVREGAL